MKCDAEVEFALTRKNRWLCLRMAFSLCPRAKAVFNNVNLNIGGKSMSYSDTATLQKPGLLANNERRVMREAAPAIPMPKKKPQNAKKKAPKKRLGKY